MKKFYKIVGVWEDEYSQAMNTLCVFDNEYRAEAVRTWLNAKRPDILWSVFNSKNTKKIAH